MKKLIFLSLIVNGCAVTDGKSIVKQRAHFDLDCDKKEIKIMEISPQIIAAKGCNKKQTYICKIGRAHV